MFVGLRTSLVMAVNIPIVVLGAIAIVDQFGVRKVSEAPGKLIGFAEGKYDLVQIATGRRELTAPVVEPSEVSRSAEIGEIGTENARLEDVEAPCFRKREVRNYPRTS